MEQTHKKKNLQINFLAVWKYFIRVNLHDFYRYKNIKCTVLYKGNVRFEYALL